MISGIQPLFFGGVKKKQLRGYSKNKELTTYWKCCFQDFSFSDVIFEVLHFQKNDIFALKIGKKSQFQVRTVSLMEGKYFCSPAM